MPPDLTFGGDGSLEGLQRDFDRLSWATFIALNWPATADGEPDKTKVIGQDGDNPTVWEAYKETTEIFLPGGRRPSDWGTPPTPPDDWPEACKDQYQPGDRLLVQISKVPNAVLTQAAQPFNTGPLIDQNGRYARFEILVNRPMFQTILDGQLYSKKGQEGVKKVVFPCGSKKTGEVGAIVVKAAWKILSESEAGSGRFHTLDRHHLHARLGRPAHRGRNASGPRSASSACTSSTRRSALPNGCGRRSSKSTTARPTARSRIGRAYNFYNKDAPGPEAQHPPPRPWNPNKVEPPDRRAQVVRMIPITAATKALNAAVSGRAAGGRQAGQAVGLGELRADQHAMADEALEGLRCRGRRTGRPDRDARRRSSSATRRSETYIQGKVPNVSSSCMECHANATTTQVRLLRLHVSSCSRRNDRVRSRRIRP